jgi:integrase
MSGRLIHRGKNSWILRIEKNRDPRTKERVYRSRKFVGDRHAARAELNKMLEAQPERAKCEHVDMTVNDYFNLWFETVAENRYRYKTVENYKWIINFDVRPVIGHIPLSNLQSRDIQRVLNAMKARGVCSNTRRRLYSVISTAFERAVAWKLLETNPVLEVKMPRQEPKKIRAMTQEEIGRFVEGTDKGRHKEYFRTALVTGMRPGELAGLRWHDVDFGNLTISVQRSLAWKARFSDGWILVPTKTTRGRRQITMSKSLADSLEDLMKRQDSVKRANVNGYKDDGFVFANRCGRPVHPRFITRVFKIALLRAGLPETTRLYDLRHTNATLLLRAGEPIKAVSERLGHSTVWITLQIYAHVLPGMQRSAADKMEDLLEGNVDECS